MRKKLRWLSSSSQSAFLARAAIRLRGYFEKEIFPLNVKVDGAKKTIGTQKTIDKVQKTRVAAYCRVSTDSTEQETSYETQIEHYTSYIESHPDWVLAGIYADDGISGMNTKKRDKFHRMINDCNNGKIDMVITKSISRFARNTVDCLNYTRALKNKNIGVYFEKKDFDTAESPILRDFLAL